MGAGLQDYAQALGRNLGARVGRMSSARGSGRRLCWGPTCDPITIEDACAGSDAPKRCERRIPERTWLSFLASLVEPWRTQGNGQVPPNLDQVGADEAVQNCPARVFRLESQVCTTAP